MFMATLWAPAMMYMPRRDSTPFIKMSEYVLSFFKKMPFLNIVFDIHLSPSFHYLIGTAFLFSLRLTVEAFSISFTLSKSSCRITTHLFINKKSFYVK